MTPTPEQLQHALDKALTATIENLFNNLISNIVAPIYDAHSTPIQRFERGFKVALDAYREASAVLEKLKP